jgi:hypothetical protein
MEKKEETLFFFLFAASLLPQLFLAPHSMNIPVLAYPLYPSLITSYNCLLLDWDLVSNFQNRVCVSLVATVTRLIGKLYQYHTFIRGRIFFGRVFPLTASVQRTVCRMAYILHSFDSGSRNFLQQFFISDEVSE